MEGKRILYLVQRKTAVSGDFW